MKKFIHRIEHPANGVGNNLILLYYSTLLIGRSCLAANRIFFHGQNNVQNAVGDILCHRSVLINSLQLSYQLLELLIIPDTELLLESVPELASLTRLLSMEAFVAEIFVFN